MFWKFRRPFKHKIIDRYCPANKSFSLLDIGCWKFSPLEFKKSFPGCQYYGLDMQPVDEASRQLMEYFYLIDLSNDKLDEIPDNFFDIIVLSHVIEHLHNGQEIIKRLLNKVTPGGLIYIEYPSVRSLSLPSRPDTLNFCDDETHVSLYSLKELGNLFLNSGFKVIKAGPRRDIYRIITMPSTIIWQLLRYRTFYSYILWDTMSFAEYILARKK